MIFVTAGTIHFTFERLVELVEVLKKENKKNEKIIFQHGFTQVRTRDKDVKYIDFIDSKVFSKYLKKARLVITQGGPASIYQTLYEGKKPWVLPRKKMFGEHVNDHQIMFCETLHKKGLIKLVDHSNVKIMLKLGSTKVDFGKKIPSSRFAIINKLDQIIKLI